MPETSHKVNMIELSHVDVASARDSSHRVVEDVNWVVQEGDFWIIDGPNTSGKTNLIATATCLQRPISGIINLFGRNITELHEPELLKQRLRLGIVFKAGGRMFSNLSVLDNISLPLCYQFNWTQSQALERVEALLQLTGLTPYAYDMAETLTPTWQQRVGLARAMALKPEILFLDDPLAGMEQNHRTWWQDFLVQLSKGIPYVENRPMTLAIATNDFDRWLTQGRQFAVVKGQKWQVLDNAGETKNVTGSDDY